MTEKKREYVAPKLIVHGDISELTKGTVNEGCPSDWVDKILPGLECEPE